MHKGGSSSSHPPALAEPASSNAPTAPSPCTAPPCALPQHGKASTLSATLAHCAELRAHCAHCTLLAHCSLRFAHTLTPRGRGALSPTAQCPPSSLPSRCGGGSRTGCWASSTVSVCAGPTDHGCVHWGWGNGTGGAPPRQGSHGALHCCPHPCSRVQQHPKKGGWGMDGMGWMGWHGHRWGVLQAPAAAAPLPTHLRAQHHRRRGLPGFSAQGAPAVAQQGRRLAGTLPAHLACPNAFVRPPHTAYAHCTPHILPACLPAYLCAHCLCARCTPRRSLPVTRQKGCVLGYHTYDCRSTSTIKLQACAYIAGVIYQDPAGVWRYGFDAAVEAERFGIVIGERAAPGPRQPLPSASRCCLRTPAPPLRAAPINYFTPCPPSPRPPRHLPAVGAARTSHHTLPAPPLCCLQGQHALPPP